MIDFVDTKEFYSVNEIAESLNVSDWVIRKAIERGELKAISIGEKLVRIPHDAYIAWLNSRQKRGEKK